MWRGVVAVGLVLGFTMVSAPCVYACSCAFADPHEQLEEGDAAFVGTLVSREEQGFLSSWSGDHEVTWTFQVEQAVKGEFGEQVEVESPVDGAACGFGVVEGQRVGVVLYWNDGQWRGGLCGQVAPDTLLVVAGEAAGRAEVAQPTPDAESAATPDDSSTSSGGLGWWLGIGLLAVVVAGGWGMFRRREHSN